jgi:two-component system sensor histidine kinase/response regulator
MSLMLISSKLDDVEVLKKLSARSRMAPYLVRSVSDFELNSAVPEAILCDPEVFTELNAEETFRIVRAKYPHSILIAVLERDVFVDYDKLLDCGVNEFIRRPIDIMILSARLQSQIRQSELSKIASENGRIVHTLLKATAHDLGNLVEVVRMRLRKISKSTPTPNPEIALVQSRIDDMTAVLRRVQNTYLHLRATEEITIYDRKPLLPIVEKAIGICSDLFTGKGIEFERDFHLPPDFSVPVIEDLFIYQILMNFMSNAMKFSSVDGVIRVTVETDATHAKVTIRDFGTGIEPEIRNKLFKGSGVRSTSGTLGESGLGLGLSIASDFINRIGGRLDFSSQTMKESPNDHGTSFTVSLPIELSHSAS